MRVIYVVTTVWICVPWSFKMRNRFSHYYQESLTLTVTWQDLKMKQKGKQHEILARCNIDILYYLGTSICVCVRACVWQEVKASPRTVILRPLKRIHIHTHTHAGKKMQHSLLSHRKFCSCPPFPVCLTLTLKTHMQTHTNTHILHYTLKWMFLMYTDQPCKSLITFCKNPAVSK